MRPAVPVPVVYFGNGSQLKEAKALDLLQIKICKTMTEQNTDTYRAGCFYICFCFYFLASGPLFGYREVCTPVAVVSREKQK